MATRNNEPIIGSTGGVWEHSSNIELEFVQLHPFGASGGETGEIRFLELVAGGFEYVGFRAPDAVTTSIIWTLPVADGAAGQFLRTDGNGVLTWVNSAGGGDVFGPASAIDNAIARYDDVSGKLLQNSGVYITDEGRLGINTPAVPHGGIGVAKLAIDGTDSSGSGGPNVQFTTDTDNQHEK